jgi:hypothetical protein
VPAAGIEPDLIFHSAAWFRTGFVMTSYPQRCPQRKGAAPLVLNSPSPHLAEWKTIAIPGMIQISSVGSAQGGSRPPPWAGCPGSYWARGQPTYEVALPGSAKNLR